MGDSFTELNKAMVEGNENEKDGQAIRSHLNTSVTNFATELLSDVSRLVRIVAVPIIVMEFNQMTETPLNSVLNDCTNYGTEFANVIDDLRPTLYFTPLETPIVTIHGDLNDDKRVDVADVNALINVILGNSSNDELLAPGDLTGDGIEDISDVNALINIILSN
ncbi:MAG: hypothetical protein J5565_05255 [Muribaculaceae bacterium]|nr:hypothetical protein [Muribaculaceae bacterium]